MQWKRRPPTPAEELWPVWTPVVEAAAASLLAVFVALQARPDLGRATSITLAALPALMWVGDAVLCLPPFRVRAVVVIACVAILSAYPAKIDVSPFFLALLIGESVVVAGVRDSIVVTLASSAAIGGLDLAGRYDGSYVWILAFAFTWSGVALVQSRLSLIDAMAVRAATEERQRIARELHDVVAHTLAVTMLNLTGARLALERDPADAAEALREAERLGRQSLAEIRRAVGLLAPDGDTPTHAMPTASDIPDLVRGVADAGLDVQLQCHGDLASVAPTTGLNLYRIVQESLANVVKHMPGSGATVDVRVDDRAVHVDVTNPLLAPAKPPRSRDDGGLGLRLMRERAELLGGTFSAGPHGSCWRVALVVPRGAPA